MPETPAYTTRAYTLRLAGATPEDHAWRGRLWQTHEAVNKGARVFGEWLLTMRGGLDHTLADQQDPQQRRDHRVALALSWLSVESPAEAVASDLIVSRGKDPHEDRSQALEIALREILQQRGLSDADIDSWLVDCRATLGARIRDDAVWVNRSKAFDAITEQPRRPQARVDCQVLLWHLFTHDYLTLPRASLRRRQEQQAQREGADQDPDEGQGEDKRSAVVRSGRGAGTRTRHLFSHIFGGSPTFGKDKHKEKEKERVLALRGHWLAYLQPLVEGAGIPLRDPSQPRRANDGAVPTELHREMLSKAAARLAQIHTKQKQQEIEREQRERADEALRRLEDDPAYKEALALLEAYCDDRRAEWGDYTIRPRALEGWRDVVAAWALCGSEDERVDEVKRLQDEDPDRKFGDPNLFCELAQEKYVPVWRHCGKEDPDLLTRFVKGNAARADAKRLRVAAYRHPDPCFNPVFCQFGISRPAIKFARLGQLRKSKEPGSERSTAVSLLLWDGKAARTTILQALGARLDREIGTVDQQQPLDRDPTLVTRRTRQGFAVAAQESASGEGSRVIGVFDEQDIEKRRPEHDQAAAGKVARKAPEWNGTLQADRRALAAIGRAADAREAARAREQLQWWLTVSIELRPQGPWPTYADKHGIELDRGREGIVTLPTKKADEWRGLAYPCWVDDNKGRHGRDRLVLARLPGLRVLSVDLGHRAAASCAIWETLTRPQVEEICRACGHDAPGEGDIYLHLKRKVLKQDKGGSAREAEATTIYRRLAADTLPDGSPHPAPWARLDRWFTIRLQGEEAQARFATRAEQAAVRDFEKWLGWQAGNRRRSQRIDELVAHAVDLARRGLRRHADHARIAWGLAAPKKQLPGGRRPDGEMSREERVAHLQGVLLRWHDIAFSTQWKDDWAQELWNATLPDYQKPEPIAENASAKEKKAARERNLETLRPAATALAEDSARRLALHEAWKSRWAQDDGAPAQVDRQASGCKQSQGTGWHAHLRWLHDWLLPRGNKSRKRTLRQVGGLSLMRLGTIRDFHRKVQKAFFTRLRPDGTKAEAPESFGQRTLDDLAAMRENRIKQLASRIVEAALGVGSENPLHREGRRRPRQRIADPRFAPCHAVVIEYLANYRPHQSRMRRENRQLMDWSTGRFKQYLAEACALNGLHLREVSAAYTSQQDSRTGAPGIRCEQVVLREFLQSPFWRKKVSSAAKRAGNPFTQLWRDLVNRARKSSPADAATTVLYLPREGGRLFVSASPCLCCQPSSQGLAPINADLNAAANVGLRALSDPDWPGTWWYSPYNLTQSQPCLDKAKGSAAISAGSPPAAPAQATTQEKVINLWRDVSAKPITPENGQPYSRYWNGVQERVVARLRPALGLHHEP